ncbi:MAG TPA: cupredoxin domain-containing protein, partial [Candidatus Paceibacterota bacterium]|nr:cupredoxin domain-containing protein [Candidatus Paceibacterota bacterium]
SQNTGTPGSTVTIYGIGFDSYNNTVNFAGTSLSGISSQNGTSLTFTVPSYLFSYSLVGTPVQLSVTDSHGTSNALTFTIYGGSNGYNCGTYPYVSCATCPTYQYGYNSNCNQYQPQTSTPIINYISPNAGGVGTNVTIYGAGFTANNNAVHFGVGIIANLNSYDGRSLTFTVPSSLSGYGTQPITLSTYQVSVSNANGVQSNAVPFTVTGLSSNTAPNISSVSGPNSLAVGQQGSWQVLVNAVNNSYLTLTVNWGDQNVYNASPTSQQINISQVNTLTHTYSTTGTYTIVFTVSNNQGQQNSYTTTVYVGSGVYNQNPQSQTVSIANMAFNPQTITVQRGAMITWINNDSMQHTVTSDNGFFGSGTLSLGQSYSYTFLNPGTYTYHCSIHPYMTGTIIVQ